MNARLDTQVNDLQNDYESITRLLKVGYSQERILNDIKFLDTYREQHDIYDHRFLDADGEIADMNYANMCMASFEAHALTGT